ncbi:MAG TPA: TadE/TadG family type IV pilus assembly protein [Lacipirellula sp.]
MPSVRQILSPAQRLATCCAGAALIEWTLVLPFLLTLGLGFMEFGHALYQYQQIATGVRDAGRYLSRQDIVDESTMPPTIPIELLEKARRLATTGTTDMGGELRVPYWEPGEVSADLSSEDNPEIGAGGEKKYRGGDEVYMVRVTAEVTYEDVGFLDFFGLGPINFNISHMERVIGE